MNDDNQPQRPHPLKLIGLAWRYGGRTERRLISALLFIAIPTLLLPVLIMFLSIPPQEIRQVGLALIVDFGSTIVLLPAISDATLSVRYFESVGAEGWLSPQEREYFRELVRYRKSFGGEAQIPGSVKWAVLYLVLVLGMNTGALAFVLVFYPRLGDWTAATFSVFQIPLAVMCAVLYRRRVRAHLESATLKGFRLAELRRTNGLRDRRLG